jgi:hypothetical protein
MKSVENVAPSTSTASIGGRRRFHLVEAGVADRRANGLHRELVRRAILGSGC